MIETSRSPASPSAWLRLLLVAAVACGPAGQPDPEAEADTAAGPGMVPSEPPRLRTAREVYTVRADGPIERVAIPFMYHNARDQRLYHPTCRPNGGEPTVAIGLEKLVEGEWKPAWAQALPQCLSEPIVIEPRGVFSDTLEVVLHPQDSLHQPLLTPLVEIDGTYRLVWHDLLTSYDPDSYPFGDPLPLWERISGTFRLQR